MRPLFGCSMHAIIIRLHFISFHFFSAKADGKNIFTYNFNRIFVIFAWTTDYTADSELICNILILII